MKAAVIEQYGPPEVVTVREVPVPMPGNSKVLIRVYASTVNRTDCGFRSAQYFVSRLFSGLFKPDKNHCILGNEFAGVVQETGNSVTNFKAGDRVFGFNDTTFGAHAEYMLMDGSGAMGIIPEGMPFEEAAPVTEGAHYALCDIRAANIGEGQQVLVNGATGAIGSAAVQLIKHLGAHVTAVCATPHLDLIRSLGADKVVDYTREDFTATQERYDVIFDAVGKSSFSKCRKILKPKGIYMSTELGKRSNNIFLALVTPMLGGRRVLFPLPSISREDVEFLMGLVVQGRLKPLVDRYYALEEIVEAYRYVETGFKTGNVVLRIQ